MSLCDYEEDLLLVLLIKKYVDSRKTRKSKRRPRRCWVNAYLKERQLKGRFHVDFPDMLTTVSVFKENFRMTPEQFGIIHHMIAKVIQPKANTRPDDTIGSQEKLALTIEYLASGTLFRHLGSCYRISKQSVGNIIDETCDAIIGALSECYLPKITQQFWIECAQRYWNKWNMPNCLGSIDGKHCAIRCPNDSGSVFYNYKGFFSIVLLGVVDAEYKFISFDVGAYGSEGDSSIFRDSVFGKALFGGKLSIPPCKIVNGTRLPYFFIGDDAFPLDKHIQKPYKPPSKLAQLSASERIFNYRLSRARRTVENAFGILNSRWMCLSRTMLVGPVRAQKIITACCLLHNYLITVCKDDYSPAGYCDFISEDGSVIDGYWRQSLGETSIFHNDLELTATGRLPVNAKSVRDFLKDYFLSNEGMVDWQEEAVHLK